jgi:hypothetical protein
MWKLIILTTTLALVGSVLRKTEVLDKIKSFLFSKVDAVTSPEKDQS